MRKKRVIVGCVCVIMGGMTEELASLLWLRTVANTERCQWVKLLFVESVIEHVQNTFRPTSTEGLNRTISTAKACNKLTCRCMHVRIPLAPTILRSSYRHYPVLWMIRNKWMVKKQNKTVESSCGRNLEIDTHNAIKLNKLTTWLKKNCSHV